MTQGTALSVGYDTQLPRGACGDFLNPFRDAEVTVPGRRASERVGAVVAQGLGVLLEDPDLVLRGGEVVGGHIAAEAGEAALDVVDPAVDGAQADLDQVLPGVGLVDGLAVEDLDR